MSCGDALRLFEKIPKIRRILQTLCDVGLDYLQLGQSAPTLSGGEAQRVKLAAELARPDTGQTLYLLDEPTTGLHFEDLRKLLDVLNRLVDLGNSVVVIEHNLDVIKTADWIIDMGRDAGVEGGLVVIVGTPELVVTYARRAKRNKKLLRSYTGEVLDPVLKAGPHQQRTVHDFAVEAEKRIGDLALTEIGKEQKMPWEINGSGWHTQDRVGRNGEPCCWDGEIVQRVVDQIQQHDLFSETNWSNRSVVEIASGKKSDGWFFHALTGEQWLVKMKFRTASRTFKRETLIPEIGMTPLNDMHELPIYGTDARVKVRNLRGPWQEVELKVHSLDEINHDRFWSFLAEAIAGFEKITQKKQCQPEDVMPWKVLGQKWHFARKGFPIGKSPKWPSELLEDIHDLLNEVAPEGQFLWNNQQVVHQFVTAQREPWATLYT
ncbi:MAG: excinuclease ABC subunit A, partial [Planctomycetales bacterium]